jgi:tRNA U34 5-methylaminomethyl-2-thiouridine-forming methyltransferase MnmC
MTEDSQLIPEVTADGSSTFFSEAFGEWFHSREGAYAEAQQTYVEVTHLAERAQASHLALLDVCYGLGYNTAAALKTIWQANPDCQVTLRALEINPAVPRRAIAHNLLQGWPVHVQRLLAQLAETHYLKPSVVQETTAYRIDADLLVGDARETIQALVRADWQADAIFLDPFSPPRCPQLWTLDFIRLVAQCLKPDGYLATYSCAAAVRAALQQAGLVIGATRAAGRRWPGTVARHAGASLPPLSPQEAAHLNTRAAVPYRDPSLTAAAVEIRAQRQQAQTDSALEPTGQWRRRWLGKG